MSPVTVRHLHDRAEILRARRLHGRRYLEVGFVDHLDPGGVIDDPYVEVSDYFGAYDASERLLGVYRMIPATRAKLPILTDFELDDDGRRLFDSLAPHQVAEMSALAVARADCAQSGEVARGIYRSFFHHALVEARYTHVAAALDARVARVNERRYGSTFAPVGPGRYYMGSFTIPMVFDVLAQLRHYVDCPSAHSDYFLEGLVIDLRDDQVVASADTSIPRAG